MELYKIAQLLEDTKKALGFTKDTQLARKLGVNRTRINRWQTGYSKFKEEHEVTLRTLIENARLKREVLGSMINKELSATIEMLEKENRKLSKIRNILNSEE